MALVGSDLPVGGVGTGGTSGIGERADLARPVENVALDPDRVNADVRIGKETEGLDQPAAVAAHVVGVHRAHQCRV